MGTDLPGLGFWPSGCRSRRTMGRTANLYSFEPWTDGRSSFSSKLALAASIIDLSSRLLPVRRFSSSVALTGARGDPADEGPELPYPVSVHGEGGCGVDQVEIVRGPSELHEQAAGAGAGSLTSLTISPYLSRARKASMSEPSRGAPRSSPRPRRVSRGRRHRRAAPWAGQPGGRRCRPPLPTVATFRTCTGLISRRASPIARAPASPRPPTRGGSGASWWRRHGKRVCLPDARRTGPASLSRRQT